MHDLTDVPRPLAAPAPEWPEQAPPTAEFSEWLPYHPSTAGLARRLLRDFLAVAERGELLLPDGEIVLGELIGNAIRYGRTAPDQLILLRFEQVPDGLLRIEVHDANSECRPVRRRPGSTDERGRGLLLVESVAREWGVGARLGVGKMVWATVAPTVGS